MREATVPHGAPLKVFAGPGEAAYFGEVCALAVQVALWVSSQSK